MKSTVGPVFIESVIHATIAQLALAACSRSIPIQNIAWQTRTSGVCGHADPADTKHNMAYLPKMYDSMIRRANKHKHNMTYRVMKTMPPHNKTIPACGKHTCLVQAYSPSYDEYPCFWQACLFMMSIPGYVMMSIFGYGKCTLLWWVFLVMASVPCYDEYFWLW